MIGDFISNNMQGIMVIFAILMFLLAFSFRRLNRKYNQIKREYENLDSKIAYEVRVAFLEKELEMKNNTLKEYEQIPNQTESYVEEDRLARLKRLTEAYKKVNRSGPLTDEELNSLKND